jgi:serine/threonine protein kinase
MYENKAERDALFSTNGKYAEVRLLNDAPTGFGWAILVNDYFNKPCVAKLPNSQAATTELRNEAEILARIRELEHPNLVQLRDVEKCSLTWHGSVEERLFLVLQYGGVNLRSRLGKLGIRRGRQGDEYTYTGGQPLPLDEWFQISEQVAAGLQAMHEYELEPGEHIVHRDIKPENILIDKDGRVRITDFGISRVVERLTQSFTVGGTPPYLAPEYLRGRINASCDVYSFGIILYEMATGRYPFVTQEDKLWELPPPPHEVNPDVPEPVSRLILKALEYDNHAPRGEETRNRYQTGGQLLAELRRCKQRIYPVPPQFEQIQAHGPERHLYRERASQQAVRLFLYDLPHKGATLYRLAGLVDLKREPFVTPLRLFEADNVIGVVTPTVPWDAPHAAPAEAVTVTHTPPNRTSMSAPQRVRPPMPAALHGPAAEQALHQVADLADLLQPLHELGICHGGLSPFTAVRRDDQRWIVDDLWIQAFVGNGDRSRAWTSADPATACLAPEMAEWTTPPRVTTDVYGLGTIAYALLTGRTPTPDAGTPAHTAAQVDAHLWWPDDIPLRWRNCVERALHPQPNERYATLQAMADELRACHWESDWFEGLLDRIRELHRSGQTVEAYDALDQAQKRDPGHPGIHHVRAELFYADGSPEYALLENQAAYSIDPQPEVCFLQARCCQALERYAEAERYFQEGLQQRDDAEARRGLEQCRQLAGGSETDRGPGPTPSS